MENQETHSLLQKLVNTKKISSNYLSFPAKSYTSNNQTDDKVKFFFIEVFQIPGNKEMMELENRYLVTSDELMDLDSHLQCY